MISAVLAALALLVAWPGRATGRWRAVCRAKQRRPIDLGLVAAGLTPILAGLIFGWLGFLAALALAPVVKRQVSSLGSIRERRLQEQLAMQAPAALDLITAALQAGRSAEGALAVVAEHSPAPLGDLLRETSRRLRISADPVAVWSALDGTALEVVGRAFGRSESTGAAVVPLALDAAEDLRRNARGVRREAVGRIGVQTTVPLGLCLLPAFVLVAIGPTVLAFVGSVLR